MSGKKQVFCYVTTKGKTVKPGAVMAAMKTDSKQVDDSWGTHYPEGILEPPYPPDSLVNVLDVSTWHATCCNIIAEDVAGMGWELLPKPGKDKPSEAQKKKIEDFIEALSEPLEDTLAAMMVDFNSLGWGAIELIRDAAGELYDLTHIPASEIRVHVSKKKYAQRKNGRTVWFHKPGEARLDHKTGQPGNTSNELLFFRQYSPRSKTYGLPRIIPSLGAVLGDVSRQEYNNSFFSNHGVPAYAIFVSGDYDPGPVDPQTDKTELETVIEQHLAELQDNPHSTLVLTVPSRRRPDGSPGQVEVKIERLGGEVKEASFAKFRKDNRDEIFAAHGVPLARAGISDSGTMGQSAAAETTENYKRSVVDPRQRKIEKRFDSVILKDALGIKDYEWRFKEIDTRDKKADVEVAVPLFGMGAITPNELIHHFGREFGLKPSTAEGMDHHFIGGKSVEAGEVLRGRANVPGVNPGSLPEDDPSREGQPGDQSETLRKILEEEQGLSREARDILQAQLDSERA